MKEIYNRQRMYHHDDTIWEIRNKETTMTGDIPENLYTGELITYPGPYSFYLGKQKIILVSDAELETLAEDPEAVIDLSMTYAKYEDSLRSICERAKAHGQRTLLISFDHFFAQYRPGQHTPRKLMPDMNEYIQHIAKISDFASQYGLALELGLLSPLEIGPGYRQKTGESGMWMHYRKGLRDPQTGQFSVQLWRQQRWVNNKGPVDVEDAGVRVFAFRQQHLHGTPYLEVNPDEITEITDIAHVDEWDGATISRGGYRAQRIRVHGQGKTNIGPLDRVLVVQTYDTPEMDYFSQQALPFLIDLVDRYVDAGIRFNGLYSDEMHIQQDWGYFDHHDNGEFAVRYVSDGFCKRFAEEYGSEYEDFAKYLVYFCRGQEDTRNDLEAKRGMMHVFGFTPRDIRRTALFRARYYRMLQDGVVDLFLAAKRHLEKQMGHRLHTRAHATWAESPTVDHWKVGPDHSPRNRYEYTSNFVWSCTVHQAAAACHDYFKWGEYLTGTGNDHAECGWLDRDYYALALACSTGIVNEVPYSYATHWGSPPPVHQRHHWLQSAYGAAGSFLHTMVQGAQHRDVDVLLLYPLDLVSVDERFGSWIVQYGYANYLTTAKLLEMGEVRDGAIEIAGRRFSTVVTLFEPYPPRKLLSMMRQLADQGGRVVWSGPPPLLDWHGEDLLNDWKDLFAVTYEPNKTFGWLAPGRRIEFAGILELVTPQTILTDFLVDRIYPVVPADATTTVATIQDKVVGAHRTTAKGGSLTFLGFRPRDDQSQSLGYDVRTLFTILLALGAYPSTQTAESVNDNTEVLSRTGDYLVCRFPNGAISLAPHLRTYEESWSGGFARKPEEDKKYLADNPPPSPELHLDHFQVNGHTVSYDGHGVMTFRTDDGGKPIAFAGHHSNCITIDGNTWCFTEHSADTVFWAPVPESRRIENGAVMIVRCDAEVELRIPAKGLPEDIQVVTEGAEPGSRGNEVEAIMGDGGLIINIAGQARHRLLYVVEKP